MLLVAGFFVCSPSAFNVQCLACSGGGRLADGVGVRVSLYKRHADSKTERARVKIVPQPYCGFSRFTSRGGGGSGSDDEGRQAGKQRLLCCSVLARAKNVYAVIILEGSK